MSFAKHSSANELDIVSTPKKSKTISLELFRSEAILSRVATPDILVPKCDPILLNTIFVMMLLCLEKAGANLIQFINNKHQKEIVLIL